MGQTLSNLIQSLKIASDDAPSSHLINTETPGVPNGVLTQFRLQNANVVQNSVYVTMGASFRTQAGFTVDYANGIITFTSAPLLNVNPFSVDYAFLWLVDSDYEDFLTQGARFVGPGDNSDPTAVSDGLIPAMLDFALCRFWKRRATAYAHKFSSSGGQAGQSVDVVTKAYNTLAESAYKSAKELRSDYYDRQGQKKAPASAVINYAMDPYSPPR
jgi:hypothetical protein